MSIKRKFRILQIRREICVSQMITSRKFGDLEGERYWKKELDKAWRQIVDIWNNTPKFREEIHNSWREIYVSFIPTVEYRKMMEKRSGAYE